MTTPIAPVSFSYETAEAATGISARNIRRAVDAGDITVRYPVIDGRQTTKPVILRDELYAWIARGATERRAS